jgi:PTS system nitrogen regulatory IIA component
MNQIASLLPTSNIVLGLDAGTKARLFEEMGTLFEGNAGLSRASVAASLAAR